MFNFDHTYLKLPDAFYAHVVADEFPQPKLLAFNSEFAEQELELKFRGLHDQDLADIFSGQKLPEHAKPIALAYAGHQFGHFVPQLGDGRALLLGETLTSKGKRYDVQLKGAGPTPFSRNGDGKSSLGPVIREYIVSEAMHYLNVPTTRALAAVLTGEEEFREQALPGAVFTRVASSHIRVGTFEYFAVRRDVENLKVLADYAMARHYAEIDKEDPNKYLSFLERVAKAQAHMVALWLSYGFIHGVMNTDNMSISGETIDYGPCAFMDNFSFDKVFSSIDRGGRYRYQNQIPIAKWNLTRLASCLIPLVHENEKKAIVLLEETLEKCFHFYEASYRVVMAKKLGIFEATPGDDDLIKSWLQYLEKQDLDFTLSFRNLSEASCGLSSNPSFQEFYSNWQSRLAAQSQTIEAVKELMRSVNPVFIPRNHQVEAAIQAALKGDLTLFNELNLVLKKPFHDQAQFKRYQFAPEPEERIGATFCGT